MTHRFALIEYGLCETESDSIRTLYQLTTKCEQHWKIIDKQDATFAIMNGPGKKTACDGDGNYLIVTTTAYRLCQPSWVGQFLPSSCADGLPIINCEILNFDDPTQTKKQGYLAICRPQRSETTTQLRERNGFGTSDDPLSSGRPCLMRYGGRGQHETCESAIKELLKTGTISLTPNRKHEQ